MIFVTSAKHKKLLQAILSTAFIISSLITVGYLFASETRGIRVLVRDASSGQQKEIKLYNRSYAVIIGIDQYQNLHFDKQLAYAVRDARGVEQVLRKNFKFDKIITLYNKDATKDKIMEVLLGDLSKEVAEEDSVFVFWAGHGYTEKTPYGDLGYLIPFDGTFETSELYKNISMTMLRDDISKKIPAKHVFYVMDACYSGLLVTTRGAERKSSRDYNYLQEITKENVRQVLTAGDKGQEVLDGGPKGHSVFTGRFIEILENSEDFITATEISTMLKEKVFSDARARNHTQTPKFGELFGVGDFVFIPSLEQKVEDTKSRIADYQKELEKLKATEEVALRAKDEMTRRQAELEKRTIEAKLKAEQLKQQALEEDAKKREQEEKERIRFEEERAQQKKAEEKKLAYLKRDVEEKRKTLGSSNIGSLSLEGTVTEMHAIDAKIREIREAYRKELTNSINQIIARLNQRYLKLADAKKDEFETVEEFKNRIAMVKNELGYRQTSELTALQTRMEDEYTQQINPLIKQLKNLLGNEVLLTDDEIELELGTYDAISNTYPVTIKAKQPVMGILVAANANIPIPRDEAREFKQHFENNMLRVEISGNFQTPEVFRITQAYIIDDATTKQYDLFSLRFVDLGNGIVYDSETKLIWSKNANPCGQGIHEKNVALQNIVYLNETGYCGFKDWRLPTKEELLTLVKYAKFKGYGILKSGKTIADFLEKEGFSNVMHKYYWSSSEDRQPFIGMETGDEAASGGYFLHVWPVRGGH